MTRLSRTLQAVAASNVKNVPVYFCYWKSRSSIRFINGTVMDIVSKSGLAGVKLFKKPMGNIIGRIAG